MLALAIFVVWFLVLAAVRGASLDVFWDWFVRYPGVWPDAPDLTTGSALGLSFVITFLTYQFVDDSKENEDATTILLRGVGKSLVFYAFVWVAALIYHYLFGIGV
jgi:hypothetical protein